MLYSRLILFCLAQCMTQLVPASTLLDMSLEELMQIKITAATGTPTPLYQAPAISNVITAQDIQKTGATTLAEALEQIPGLHISLSTRKNLQTVFSIRGIHTSSNNQVLLTINGIPVRQPFAGTRIATYRLPTANIARIEVIRGPGSAVHGADAFSGVINVVTKDSEDLNGFHAGARMGSFDSQAFWLQYGQSFADWQLAFSLENLKSDGDDRRRLSRDAATPLGTSLSDQYPMQTYYDILNARAEIKNQRWTVSLSRWLQREAGTGPGILQAIDPVGWQKGGITELDIEYRLPELLPDWQMRTRLSHQKIKDDNLFMLLPPGSVMPVGDDGNLGTTPHPDCPETGGPRPAKACLTAFTDGLFGAPGGKMTSSYWTFDAIFNGMAQHRIRINTGATYHKMYDVHHAKNFGPGTPAAHIGDQIASQGLPPGNLWIMDGNLTDVGQTDSSFIAPNNQRRQSWHLALQDEWKFAPDWTFTGGARYDHFSDFGSTFNPRAALVWQTSPQLTSRLLYGSAFRAPAMSELYLINNPARVGNPNLQPEKNQTLELAFDFRPSASWRHKINSYYYQASNLIEADPQQQSQNTGEQTGYGLELESHWQASREVNLMASYAWQRAEDKKHNSRIANYPGRELSAGITWQPGRDWQINSQLHHIMDRRRASFDRRDRIDDYSWMTVTANYAINSQLEIAASIRNLLNDNAREPGQASTRYLAEDYPLARRHGFIELRYTLDGIQR